LVVAGPITASSVRADSFESVTGGSAIDFNDAVKITGELSGSNSLWVGNQSSYISSSNGNIFATGNVSGSVSSTGSFGRVEVVNRIARTGDPDTHIYFSDDDINIQAGGVNMIDITQDTTSEITFNEGAADLDFSILSNVYHIDTTSLDVYIVI
jgi:hypothetical protein